MSRVLAFAIPAVAAILVSALALDWFVVDIRSPEENIRFTIDLLEARACASSGECDSVSMNMIDTGMYGTLSKATLFTSLVLAVLVIVQVGFRLTGRELNETVTKAGHGLSSLVVTTTIGAGYVLGPDVGKVELGSYGFFVERGDGPIAMLLGALLAAAALYFLREAEADKPVAIAAGPYARTHGATTPPPPVVAEQPSPPQRRAAAPTTPPPVTLKGRVQFAALAGELTVAGIDARREDGDMVLVMWRDVVGLVVRKLPAELDSHPFLDIVSTAGMTLRILPWTKLTGEPVAGEPEARLRSLVELVKPRCPEVKIDRATQAFLDGKPAPQLPSMDVLAKHDQALA